MNTEKLMGVLEEYIKEISSMNELISRRLPHLAETNDIRNLQKLVLERERLEKEKDHDMGMQLMHTELPKGIDFYAVPFKLKSIVLKFKSLNKPFIPFNTLEFLLSLDNELKSANDDLPKRIQNLYAYKTEPFLIQHSLALYLQTLIHGYFEINKFRNDENAVNVYFKSLQAETKKFLDQTTAKLENPLNGEMKDHFDKYLKKTFSGFMAVNVEIYEKS